MAILGHVVGETRCDNTLTDGAGRAREAFIMRGKRRLKTSERSNSGNLRRKLEAAMAENQRGHGNILKNDWLK